MELLLLFSKKKKRRKKRFFREGATLVVRRPLDECPGTVPENIGSISCQLAAVAVYGNKMSNAPIIFKHGFGRLLPGYQRLEEG